MEDAARHAVRGGFDESHELAAVVRGQAVLVDHQEILVIRRAAERALACDVEHLQREAPDVGARVGLDVGAAVRQAQPRAVTAGCGEQAVAGMRRQVGQHLERGVERQQRLAVQRPAVPYFADLTRWNSAITCATRAKYASPPGAMRSRQSVPGSFIGVSRWERHSSAWRPGF